MDQKTVKLSVLALVVLAFVLRAGFVFYSQAYKQPNAMEHESIAISVVNGWGFKFADWQVYRHTSVQSPPYPWILTACFYTLGEKNPETGLYDNNRDRLANAYIAAMMLNSIVGAINVLALFYLVQALGGSDKLGLIAAAMLTIWPTQVYSASTAQAICLITCGLTAMMLFFIRGVQTGKLGYWIAFSAIGCLAALTEPVFLPAMALTGVIILFWRSLPFPKRLAFAVTLFIAACVIIGPWTVRNRMVHGKWVPIKNTFWVNVWKGNNEYATGTDRLKISDEVRDKASGSLLSTSDNDMRSPELDNARQYDMLTSEQRSRLYEHEEMEREDAFKDWATAWIKANPMGYVKMCFIRLGKTLWIDWDNPKSYKLVYISSRALLQALTLAGLYFAFKLRWQLFFPLLVIGTCLLTYTLTVTAARFSIPFEPFQLALASLAIGAVLGWTTERTAGHGFEVRTVPTGAQSF